MNVEDPRGEFPNRGEVCFVRSLPGPIERVWEYLTDPEKRSRWFAGGPMEPRVGGRVRLEFRHANFAAGETPPAEYKQFHEPGAELPGRITRWDPPRVLAYTFGSTGESEVIFELSTIGRQVRLVLTHRARGGDGPFLANFAAGWHTHLAHLRAEMEGGRHPPFWPLHARLEEEYAKRLARGDLL